MLTDRDRAELAEAVLVWRYTRHLIDPAHRGFPSIESEEAAYRAIDLAKLIGVKDEFLKLMFDHPVLSISVKNLEPPQKAGPKRKRKR